MYINDIHILLYVVAGILGFIVGAITNYCNYRMMGEKKIFTKDMLKLKKENMPTNYVLMISNAIIYIALLYFCGIHSNFYENLALIKFGLLTPMLLSALTIDYKLQIIPNRLNLTMFEIGLLTTFIYGTVNINIAFDMLLGMICGAGIFLIITVLGGFIAGKEAMGFGDVKLMGALGLFFGRDNMLMITAIAFLLGAIISVFLLATKIKKSNEYIPFGPFIVMAAFIVLFVPFGFLKNILFEIFTLGLYNSTI